MIEQLLLIDYKGIIEYIIFKIKKIKNDIKNKI